MPDTLLRHLEDLPDELAEALAALPGRVLFHNEFLQLLLVGFERGQESPAMRPPWPILLTVTFGDVLFCSEQRTLDLAETEQIRVEAAESFTLRAVESSDLLLRIPSRRSATARANLNFGPCDPQFAVTIEEWRHVMTGIRR